MATRLTRPAFLVPALVAALLATAAPVAAAPAVDPSAQPAFIEFDLPANNGLHAHLEVFNDEVELEIERKNRVVSYEVPGEATEAGLKVRFGKLGLIDVAFWPTETDEEEPPKGCRGKPSTYSQGLFVGTIDFTGERKFVRIDAGQVDGRLEVNRESEWRCPGHKRSIRFHGAPRLSILSLREQPEPKKETASLAAVDYRCGCVFGAFAFPTRKGPRISRFYGAKFEKREGMEISRVTSANAGAGAFLFDHAAGTARVRPPQPFSGGGLFKRHPHSRDLWRSTIQVPLLGADPLSFDGPRFRARLTRELPGGE